MMPNIDPRDMSINTWLLYKVLILNTKILKKSKHFSSPPPSHDRVSISFVVVSFVLLYFIKNYYLIIFQIKDELTYISEREFNTTI